MDEKKNHIEEVQKSKSAMLCSAFRLVATCVDIFESEHVTLDNLRNITKNIEDVELFFETVKEKLDQVEVYHLNYYVENKPEPMWARGNRIHANLLLKYLHFRYHNMETTSMFAWEKYQESTKGEENEKRVEMV